MKRIVMLTVLATVAIAFVSPALAQEKAPSGLDPAFAGRQEYEFNQCGQCHFIGDSGNRKGTTLEGVGSKLTADQIRSWITNAPEMAAKAKSTVQPPMEAYKLSGKRLDSLVLYLTTLKK